MRTLTDLICVSCIIGDYVSSYLVFLFNVRLTQSSALFPRMVTKKNYSNLIVNIKQNNKRGHSKQDWNEEVFDLS